MESDRFDNLGRSFGQLRSRRQTVRGLAGAAAAGVVALGGPARTTLHLATAPSPRFEEAQANPAGRIDVVEVERPAAGWPA